MNYTTADYLESLQNDLDTIVNTLGLEEGTNFSNIAEMTTQGEISKGGGVDLSNYFGNTITYGNSNTPGWKNVAKAIPENITLQDGVTNCTYMFFTYPAEKLSLPNLNMTNVTDAERMFQSCTNLKELDISNCETPNLTNATYMFGFCRVLEKIDMRKFSFTQITSKNNMFYLVPTSCLIIVKDSTEKAWMNSNFSSYTNVKTVEEYEG